METLVNGKGDLVNLNAITSIILQATQKKLDMQSNISDH